MSVALGRGTGEPRAQPWSERARPLANSLLLKGGTRMQLSQSLTGQGANPGQPPRPSQAQDLRTGSQHQMDANRCVRVARLLSPRTSGIRGMRGNEPNEIARESPRAMCAPGLCR